jgi:hypothetical protein
MHRRSLSWVLSLLLLIAQHGAVLHELSHLSHSTSAHGTVLNQVEQLVENGTCPTCQAYSQIANPATATAVALTIYRPVLLAALEPSHTIVSTDVPTPRSRGPPQA